METPDDPFRGLELDEEFIASARRHEPSAAHRLRHSSANYARLRAISNETGRQSLSPQRRWTRSRLLWLAVAAVLSIAALTGHVRPIFPSTTDFRADDTWLAVPIDGSGPTPRAATSTVPLGVPQQPPVTAGSFAYAATQADASTPVAYDPCRPLRYVVNPRTAPSDGEQLLQDSITRIQQVTGLAFEFVGRTDEVPTSQRSAYQPDRYGDEWAPILIAWSDPTELSDLADDVAGIGGSSPVQRPGDPRVYVTGLVALDGPQLASVSSVEGAAHARAVIMHELAHLVGLDHVSDPTQLMHPVATRSALGSGDVTGLSHLGAGPCVSYL